jgi:Domain of unknown function (DUF362)
VKLPARSATLLAALLAALASLASLAALGDQNLPPANGGPSAQVIVVQDPLATDAFRPDPARIDAMVLRGITNLTGHATGPAAWRSLASTQEVLGLKVYSAPGPNSGTHVAVVEAIVQQLLAAGWAPNHIVVWDKHRFDLRLAGFMQLTNRYGVGVFGSAEAGYDDHVFYEQPLLGNLVWGDHEFGKKGDGIGRNSFFSKLVTQRITKIINITPLMNHNQAGVAGNLYGLAMGSVDNTTRFEGDASRLANAVPEIYARPQLSDRVILNVVDALVCQYEGDGEVSLLHYAVELNQLRFSRDAVALDALSVNELQNQRKVALAPMTGTNLDLLSNAALLELGVNDLKRIRIENVRVGP